MDQVGYPGVDEDTFQLVARGQSPPPEGEPEGPGITTQSLAPGERSRFGRTQSEGRVDSPKGESKGRGDAARRGAKKNSAE